MKKGSRLVVSLVFVVPLAAAPVASAARPIKDCRGPGVLQQPGFAHPEDLNGDGWVCVHPKNGRVSDNFVPIAP